MSGASMAQMFAADPRRFKNFSLRADGMLLDYSRNLVNAETIQLLLARPWKEKLSKKPRAASSAARGFFG